MTRACDENPALLKAALVAAAAKNICKVRKVEAGTDEFQEVAKSEIDNNSDRSVHLYKPPRKIRTRRRNNGIVQEPGRKVREGLAEVEEANRRWQETLEQLFRAERLASVGKLVAEVGHELNNKLMPVLAYAELLKEHEFSEEILHYVNNIEKSASSAVFIINSLLNFGRPYSSTREAVNLNDTMRETLALLDYKLKNGKVRLCIKLDKDLPITAVDDKQIGQVFLNIIHNAFQAMDIQGGQLTIRSSHRAGTIIFMISDTGCGIPPSDISRIFEPFFSTKGSEGTGLGLSVSKRLIQTHGGEIKVKSTLGKGTTFTIYLPLRKTNDKYFIEKGPIVGRAQNDGNYCLIPAAKQAKSRNPFAMSRKSKWLETVEDLRWS